jgi:hypothetical protein
MKEGTTSLWARAQSAIQRAAVLYKPRLATFTVLYRGAFVQAKDDNMAHARIARAILSSVACPAVQYFYHIISETARFSKEKSY